MFVTRVAGNIVTPEIIASLEYGAAVLDTKVIVVMGHSNCGAVKATIQAKEVPGQISALYAHIQPAVDKAGPDLEAATKANAKIQAALLRQSSPVLSGLLKDGKLTLAQRTGVKDLSRVQAGLKDEATELIEKLGEGAPVFALTLKKAADGMESAAQRLQALKTDEATVKAHLGRLMRKVGVSNRIALTMHPFTQLP